MLDFLRSTMLIERLCGVFVYALTLMCTYYSLKKARSYRRFSRILNVYLVILTVMGFFYIPGEQADLSRWRAIIENWHTLSFSSFYETYMRGSTYPMGLLLMYLCQQTRIDGVLPAVCAFLFHWNIFSILKMVYKKYECSAQDLALSLLLFMSAGRFLEAISGIRCLIALAILARCFCEEFLSQKFKIRNIFIELIAALIHPLALVLLAIRLAFLFIQRARTLWGKVFNIGLSLVVIMLGLRYGQAYVAYAADKALDFLTTEVYSYTWEYIIGWILVVSTIYILYYSDQINKKILSTPFRNLLLFCVLVLAIAVVFCFEYSIFHRTISFLSMILIPISVFLLASSNKIQHRKVIYYISVILLFLACARGNLCAYKVFVLF